VTVRAKLTFLSLGQMNNSAKERLIFFCGYYFRKIFSQATAADQFRKRFYRATGKTAVSIVTESGDELLFSLKRKDKKDLQFCVRKKNSSDIQVFAQVFDKKEYEALVKKY
jgi:methylthioribose-1-phosphate isomerase